MARETRDTLYDLFFQLCNALGKRAAIHSEEQVGSWNIQYISGVGYAIHEILEHGAIHEPFGSRRRTIGEMCDVLRFAIQTASYAKAVESEETMTEEQAERLAQQDFNNYVIEVIRVIRNARSSDFWPLIDGTNYHPPHRRMDGASRVWDAFSDTPPGSGLIEAMAAYTLEFDDLVDNWRGENGESLRWDEGRLYIVQSEEESP